jgi:hypothetical protein
LLPLSFLQLALISCHHCDASADILSFGFSLRIIPQQTKLQKQILICWATFLPLPCPKISLTAQETKNREENVNTSLKKCLFLKKPAEDLRVIVLSMKGNGRDRVQRRSQRGRQAMRTGKGALW